MNGPVIGGDLDAAAIDCCAAGIVTCTSGTPGHPGAKYALAWLPLDNPENFPAEVRERHAANMRRTLRSKGSP